MKKELILALILMSLSANADVFTLTPAQKLHEAFESAINTRFNLLAITGVKLYGAIWKNPDQVNLSPCQAWSALSTDAVTVRHSFGFMGTFLNSVKPGAFTLAEPQGYTLTENSDGTVTCVAPSPSPSPTP